MRVRDEQFWQERLEAKESFNYLDPLMDRYAMIRKMVAIPKVFPKSARTMVDVGCGDGLLGSWLAREMNVEVSGFDPYLDKLDLRGAMTMKRVAKVDAEHAHTLGWGTFDVALAVGSITCSATPMDALRAITYLSDQILLVDNTQDPTPPWQTMEHRQHIPWSAFGRMMDTVGYELVKATTATVLDRRLFLKLPSPVAYWLSLFGDTFLSLVVPPPKARMTASLWRWKGG